MDIIRTCGAGLVGARVDCGKSRAGMLAAPSGTPRSVTAHVLTVRGGSCITVAEEPAITVAVGADDDGAGHASGVTLPGAGCALVPP